MASNLLPMLHASPNQSKSYLLEKRNVSGFHQSDVATRICFGCDRRLNVTLTESLTNFHQSSITHYSGTRIVVEHPVSEVWWCFSPLQSFCRRAWPPTSIKLNMTSGLNEAASGNQSVSEIGPKDKRLSFVYNVCESESSIQDERSRVRRRLCLHFHQVKNTRVESGRPEGCRRSLAHMTDMHKHTRDGHPGRERERERERQGGRERESERNGNSSCVYNWTLDYRVDRESEEFQSLSCK